VGCLFVRQVMSQHQKPFRKALFSESMGSRGSNQNPGRKQRKAFLSCSLTPTSFFFFFFYGTEIWDFSSTTWATTPPVFLLLVCFFQIGFYDILPILALNWNSPLSTSCLSCWDYRHEPLCLPFPHLCIYVCVTGVWTQGLMLGKHSIICATPPALKFLNSGFIDIKFICHKICLFRAEYWHMPITPALGRLRQEYLFFFFFFDSTVI
jgi:hypothetical protein